MGVSTSAWETRIGELVGGRARPATTADMVAGVQPRIVVEPEGEEEVAAVLAYANEAGRAVLLRGGGTQLDLGFPPRGGDILLDMMRLAAVVEHNPHDLTATVQAGVRLDTLQATLSGARQWLALDPVLPAGATVGGIVATNASGPRRLRYGGVRDQILGVRVALADGTIAKGGGKVVKNVAGYDLPKLFTGSLGTLGAIVAATFRLYPLSAAARTVVVTSPDPAPLCALAVRAIGSTLVPTALDVMGATDPESLCTFAARFESAAVVAEDQARRLIALAGELGTDAQTLEGDAEAALWQRLDNALTIAEGDAADGQAALMVKASLLPSDVAVWLARLRDTARQDGLAARWRAHAGHGLVFTHLQGSEDALVAAVEAVRRAAAERHGSVVVAAPPQMAERIDVWGPVAALDLMRRMKATFDPRGTLNPGRFVGRI